MYNKSVLYILGEELVAFPRNKNTVIYVENIQLRS